MMFRKRVTRNALLGLVFLLVSCHPASPSTVYIVDNDHVLTLQTEERKPSALLSLAGIALDPNDRLLLNGFPITLDQPIDARPIMLQIRRAVNIVLSTGAEERHIRSSAFTVGEALVEALFALRVFDLTNVPLNAPLVEGMTIHVSAPRELTIGVDGRVVQVQSSARTVGEALAEVGIPLIGEDYSLPSENEAVPSNGSIRVVRVRESIILTQKPIPFTSELVASADVPLDQNQILQPGENGLIMQRIRIRYEDGVEVARLTEAETTVRPPKNRILAYGTKIEIKTAVVDGVTIEYWRAVQMYATSYSPCRSGGDRCYSGTSSGKTLRKGMVALRYSWYLAMAGQALYIPGYGFATIEDVCGGCVGKPWIDLGYSDDDYVAWSSWVTVYFLTPVPPNIVYVLD
jgi:uncharacterized protein YabE (DUF348 family)